MYLVLSMLSLELPEKILLLLVQRPRLGLHQPLHHLELGRGQGRGGRARGPTWGRWGHFQGLIGRLWDRRI